MKHFLRSLWTLLLLMMWCSVGFAQTTIWSEDWTGCKSGSLPKNINSNYSSKNDGTKIYDDNTGGGTAPELLIKGKDALVVKVTDLKGCSGTLTLSYSSNKTSSVLVVSANGSTIDVSSPTKNKYTGTFNIKEGTTEIELKFSASSNSRIDDIKLTGTPVESKPTLTFSETEKTVYKGSESSFTMPTLVLKDKDGKEVTTGVEYLYEVTDANPEGCLDVDMITGKITFNELGTANIKVTTSTTDSGSEFNNLTASFKLTYMKDPAAKDKLFFAEAEKTIYVGKTDGFEGLSATQLNMSGAEVTPELIIYEANPADVVVIDEETGKIKSWLKTGTTTITATSTYDNEEYTASYILNYKKIETTLTLSKTSVSVNLGETPELPTCTLKAGDEIITNKPLAYTITPEGIANINATTGELTLISAGKATVNVSFIGDETYEASNIASYDLTVVDPNVTDVTFNFKKPADYGYGVSSGNKNHKGDLDDNGGQIISNGVVITSTSTNSTPNRFWYDGLRVYNNSKLVISASGYKIVKLTTEGDQCTWTYNNDGTAVCNVKTTTTLTSMTVTMSPLPQVTFFENKDNDDALITYDKKTVNATLTRTLIAKKWNTFCVPFETEIAGTALEGATVKAIGTVVGNVINLEDATKIEAGVPYLVMPTTENIVNPTFKSVTITEISAKGVGNDEYKFVGTYSPKNIKEGEFGKIWGVTAEGKLAKINANTTMKGLRAYFVFPTSAAAAKLNFDGETTGINNIETNAAVNGKVYNLNGQYVGNSLNGLKKGIYVVNGKKVIK